MKNIVVRILEKPDQKNMPDGVCDVPKDRVIKKIWDNLKNKINGLRY